MVKSVSCHCLLLKITLTISSFVKSLSCIMFFLNVNVWYNVVLCAGQLCRWTCPSLALSWPSSSSPSSSSHFSAWLQSVSNQKKHLQRKTSMKQGSHDHLTKSKEWSSSKLDRNRKGKVGDFCLGLPGSQCTENLFQMTHMLQSQFEGICNSQADHKAVIVWFVMTAATMDNMSDNRSEGSRFSSWLAPCELGLACTSFLLSLICYKLHLLPSWSLFCLWYYSFFSCNSCFGNLYR